MSSGDGGRLRLLVTGGGTGGHTYPALTTIRAVQQRAEAGGVDLEVLWVGVAHGLEARVAVAEGVPFRAITTGRLRRSPNRRELAANLADTARIPVGIGQAIAVVAGFRPDVVFSTGGYVSVPIGGAARLLRHRLVMHEQTLIVGLANRILARFADRILLSHPSSLPHLSARAHRRAVVTGNPIRPQLLAGDRAKGRAWFGPDAGLPLLMVCGGAQGAQQINALIAAILPQLLPHAQVIHQAGPGNIAPMREAAAGLLPELAARYRPVAYLGDELPDVLAAADVVVARAGAGTVAELTAIGAAMVLIPLVPTGGDEHRRTAAHLTAQHAAVMLDGPQATAYRLRDTVLHLLTDTQARTELAGNARRHGHPHAADWVVDELLAAGHHRPDTASPGDPDTRR